ncbi:TIGR00730 family Rossman fold protein [Rhodococcoides kroppenstedtii]|uniref:LOG family protein n=1 Tax=Rhodococcoides kroppenstedtii TaxID=293050 RepID=UPI0027E35679|nr:TIGR00730 family Rossman fold protein [Rhodococcus kroppenstedtii]
MDRRERAAVTAAGSAGTAVCVYCASGPVEQRHLDLAAALGTEIGRRGGSLVSGGGNVSMMGAVARATRAAGGRTVGVIPRALVEREVADVEADELVVTETMRERKRIMDDRADAFVTLPGGIGTLEELFETWTSGYLGMHTKPVVLLDPTGHFAPLVDWLTGLTGTGFVSAASMDRLVRVDTVDAALEACNLRP